TDDATYRRRRTALDRLRNEARGPAARLRDVLFGVRDPAFDPPRPLDALDSRLHASQRHAVGVALGAKDIALIHGPPGTGKTTAAVELIRQSVRRGDRVLACASPHPARRHQSARRP